MIDFYKLIQSCNKNVKNVTGVIFQFDDGTYAQRTITHINNHKLSKIHDAIDTKNIRRAPLTLTEFARLIDYPTNRSSLNKIAKVLTNGYMIKARGSNGRRVYDIPLCEFSIASKLMEAKNGGKPFILDALSILKINPRTSATVKNYIQRIIDNYF